MTAKGQKEPKGPPWPFSTSLGSMRWPMPDLDDDETERPQMGFVLQDKDQRHDGSL